MTPAVCELCGEEGEKKPSFFEEHGLNIADYPPPVSLDEADALEAEGTRYNKSGTVFEPAVYKIQIYNWRNHPDRQPRENLYYTNAKEGIQDIDFCVGPKFDTKICADKTVLDQFGFNYGFYDYYTGAWIHPEMRVSNGATLVKSGEMSTNDLVIDGTTYTIECTNTFSGHGGKQEPQEDGSILVGYSLTDSFKFSVPMEYDGLVFGIIPRRDARGLNVDENGELVTNLSEETDFEEGIYFRLNLLDRWVVDEMREK